MRNKRLILGSIRIEFFSIPISVIALAVSVWVAIDNYTDREKIRKETENRNLFLSFQLGQHVADTSFSNQNAAAAQELYKKILERKAAFNLDDTDARNIKESADKWFATSLALAGSILNQLGIQLRLESLDWGYLRQLGPSYTEAKSTFENLLRPNYGMAAVEAFDAGLAYRELVLSGRLHAMPLLNVDKRYKDLRLRMNSFAYRVGLTPMPQEFPTRSLVLSEALSKYSVELERRLVKSR